MAPESARSFQARRICAKLNAVPMPALLNRPSQRFRRRSPPRESFPDLFSFALQAKSDASLPTQEEKPRAVEVLPASLSHHSAFDGWTPPREVTPFHEQANGWTVVTNDHSPAAHYEHTMVIRKDGCPEILTLPDGGAKGGKA